jgi:hypothetical protein
MSSKAVPMKVVHVLHCRGRFQMVLCRSAQQLKTCLAILSVIISSVHCWFQLRFAVRYSIKPPLTEDVHDARFMLPWVHAAHRIAPGKLSAARTGTMDASLLLAYEADGRTSRKCSDP